MIGLCGKEMRSPVIKYLQANKNGTLTFKMDVDIHMLFKMLALEKNTTATALLEEAVIRLLNENKKI